MGLQHTLLGKVLHWGFVLLYAYGIVKQIDDLEQLNDAALLVFEVVFASVFLVLVVARYVYMRRFETFQGSVVPVHRYHKRFARWMHVAMYLCLVLLPLTGLAIAALFSQGIESGLAMDAAIGLHALSADLSYALIALHIAAALYSRAKGEGVWTSMIPVFTERGPSTNPYVTKLASMEHAALKKMEAFVASKKK
ncbi:MAG: cytochrome b/b6 domain-containing protein [Candidatus Thermoplasmatota archaeon]|nr:cytochrome b/b6 domain-containing protein [Candidatus Thermoplasmatota archaeon]MEC8708103.1 cytochrome b/b6 domain-containing protein [Candidatus Thermoplasmatota archaeon]